jgi:hypothetical protein
VHPIHVAPLLVVGHPFTEAVVLPIAPIAVAGLAACCIVAAASFGSAAAPGDGDLVRVRSGALGRLDVALRTVAAGLLLLAVVAGRVGTTAPSRNLAPTLLLALGFPVLVLLSGALGPLWRRIDPLDGVARLLRAPEGEAPPSVWPAVLPALLGVGYLAAFPDGLRPRTLAAVVLGYVLLTAAGCLALGRVRWLGGAEPLGLLLTWVGGLRRRRLSGWAPPAGAGALLGVVAGGLVFGLLRGTSLYVTAAFAVGTRAADILGVGLLAAAGGAVVWLGERLRGGGAATAAVVPVTAALVLAHALSGGRLLLALQLLPGLLVDPLGRGWSLAGIAQAAPRPIPIDAVALVLVQLGLVVGAGLVGARIIRTRTAGRGRIAAPVGVVLVLVMGGVLGVTTA